MFQKSIFSTRARDHFWRDMGANPVFWTFFYLKSHDDEIWYVGTIMCTTETPDFLYESGVGAPPLKHLYESLSVEVYCCSNRPQHEGQWRPPPPKDLGAT